MTFREVEQAARQCLPGVRIRRRTLWRYTFMWVKPIALLPTDGAPEAALGASGPADVSSSGPLRGTQEDLRGNGYGSRRFGRARGAPSAGRTQGRLDPGLASPDLPCSTPPT